MAVSLVATIGALDANSLATVAEADTYFENLMSFGQWDALDEDTKARALITATAAFAELHWKGAAMTSTQTLSFPRYLNGSSDGLTIPSSVLAALCEHALSLATSAAAGRLGLSKHQAMIADGVQGFSQGDLSVSFAAGVSETTGTAATLAQFSPRVQRLLSAWVQGSFSTDSGRRPGWGNRDANGLWWPTELL